MHAARGFPRPRRRVGGYACACPRSPQVVWRAILEYMHREKGFPADVLAVEIDLAWVQKGTIGGRERWRVQGCLGAGGSRARSHSQRSNGGSTRGTRALRVCTHDPARACKSNLTTDAARLVPCAGLIFDFRTGDTLKISEHGVVFQAIA